MPTAVLIVAAGLGARAASDKMYLPKQYQLLAGIPVLRRTVAAIASDLNVHSIQVVIHPDHQSLYADALGDLRHRCRPPVVGGQTRQASVLAGLEALTAITPARVLIHDAARPFVTAAEIGRVITALASKPGAIAALPVTDTIKRAGEGGICAGTIDRSGLWVAQTPQGFHFTAILPAHRRASVAGRQDFTDDAALAEWAGIEVALVEGSPRNVKLTTQADFIYAEQTLRAAAGKATAPDFRSGTGFDVHRFAAGDAVWLCGVRIPHGQRLDGHSDADVGLHALTDAILGALGDGDIGQHFPPSDPQWRGAASKQFLADAVRRTSERGARICNVDVTLLCEEPKISPHRDTMRAAIATILAIDIARVGVKATTTEGLGFTGRREGIAAMASAMLVFDCA